MLKKKLFVIGYWYVIKHLELINVKDKISFNIFSATRLIQFAKSLIFYNQLNKRISF